MAFEGKVAVVTGSSSGIGADIASMYASEGAKVTITGRSQEGLEETKSRCLSANQGKESHILSIQGDIADAEFQKKLIQATVDKFEGVDILVNNAGVLKLGLLGEIPLGDYDELMGVNLRAPFNLSQLAVPYLKKSEGNIVNISSVAGQKCSAVYGFSVYCVSKAALDHLTRACALELAKFNIRVNAICPGVVQTNMSRHAPEETRQAYYDLMADYHPIKGIIPGADVAEAVKFISSNKACRTTGQILGVDNGLVLKGVD